MLKTHRKLPVLGSLAGTLLATGATAALLPNGDFETPDGDAWEEVSDGGTYVFSYPATEGNPDGHGVIDHTADDGGFGIWVSNGGDVLTLDSLGLSAGTGYVFSLDMKILSGPAIGGFKVDFFSGQNLVGSTGDMRTPPIGDGTAWATYQYTVAIPANADGIKAVPLWGPASSVGYDNICVDPTPIPQPRIPNGNFENGSASWFERGGNTAWQYPPAGGNPDGYGSMTHGGAQGTFGIWVANGGAPLSLESLSLAGGDIVVFRQDMRLLAGNNIGGLKIEFLEGATFLGDTGDMRPALIGNGTSWETYTFEVEIPSNADHIKVVPLWGPGSSVGYDNIDFSRKSVVPFSADIETGTIVTWGSEGPDQLYQLQESFDEVDWEDVGPLIEGDDITSLFVNNVAPFYRVDVDRIVSEDAAVNSGFEFAGIQNPFCAEGWTCFSPPASNQPPTRITTDARSGIASMRIAVMNNASPTPNNSELQHNIAAAGGSITGGETYEFSFWAKQISSGDSYVQQYRIQWFDDSNVPIGGTEFTNFAGGDGTWEKVTEPGLVAPFGANSAFIQIFGATGAVPSDAARGEVLIDDLMLATTMRVDTDLIDATSGPGLNISWPTESGMTYQVQASVNSLNDFMDFGPVFLGDGNEGSLADTPTADATYYKVVEMAPGP